jgi:hypothetical protein
MKEDAPQDPSRGGRPERPAWQKLLRRLPWVILTLIVAAFVDKGLELFDPKSIDRLREFNEEITRAAETVQPWRAAAILWERLTTNPPGEHAGGVLTYLLGLWGRFISGGMEAIAVSLSGGWKSALPAFVGYGLGLWLTSVLFSKPGRDLNPIIAILGTILIGGLCLMLLRALMITATGVFNHLLGTVAGGTALLFSVALPVSREAIAHAISEVAVGRLEKTFDDSRTPPLKSTPVEEPQSRKDEDVGRREAAEESRDRVEGLSQTVGSGKVVTVDGVVQRPAGEAQLGAVKVARPKALRVLILLSVSSLVLASGCMVLGVYDSHPVIVIAAFFVGVLTLYIGSRIEKKAVGDRKP